MIDERMMASTAGRFCAAGATIASVCLALALLALVVLVFGNARGFAPWLWGLVAAMGSAGAWYRFRLVFDAGVFADIASIGDGAVAARLAAFDSALQGLAGRARGESETRTLPDRVRGARRLVARLASITVAQALIALLAALVR
jgi:hypothetical protein